jgi:hypothetical protein
MVLLSTVRFQRKDPFQSAPTGEIKRAVRNERTESARILGLNMVLKISSEDSTLTNLVECPLVHAQKVSPSIYLFTCIRPPTFLSLARNQFHCGWPRQTSGAIFSLISTRTSFLGALGFSGLVQARRLYLV